MLILAFAAGLAIGVIGCLWVFYAAVTHHVRHTIGAPAVGGYRSRGPAVEQLPVVRPRRAR